MANPYAGEVAIRIDSERRVMRLTLGSLAELEEALGEDSLMSMIGRFESGRFSSRDVFQLIIAGLRGGGWTGDRSDLLRSDIEGGPLEAARLAGVLLARAFELPE